MLVATGVVMLVVTGVVMPVVTGVVMLIVTGVVMLAVLVVFAVVAALRSSNGGNLPAPHTHCLCASLSLLSSHRSQACRGHDGQKERTARAENKQTRPR